MFIERCHNKYFPSIFVTVFCISPILECRLCCAGKCRTTSPSISLAMYSPEIERMLVAIETKDPLSYKRMMWYFDNIYVVRATGTKAAGIRVVLTRKSEFVYEVVREYAKHDHAAYEHYLNNYRTQAMLSGTPVVAPPYRWYCSTQGTSPTKGRKVFAHVSPPVSQQNQ